MLISYEYKNNGLLLSYLNKNGELKYKRPDELPWRNPCNWEETYDSDPERDPNYKTWNGKSVKLMPCVRPNKYTILERINELKKDVLEDVFAFTSQAPIYFVDIETKKGKDGYSEPDEATEPITLITICKGNRLMVMGTKKMSSHEIDYVEKNVNSYMEKFSMKMDIKIKWYDNERSMIYSFFKMAEKMPVITGWNFDGYDWPYLTNRYKMYNGNVASCSPVKRVETKILRNNGRVMELQKPVHKLIIDYMDLYKKYASPKLTRESAKLDYVAEKTLGVKKIQYDQDIETMMKEDYKKFVYYGSIDTILVQLIHNKMKYFNIMVSISCLSKIRAQDSLSTIAVTEGYLRKPFKEHEGIVFVKTYDDSQDSKGLPGGWVKHPVRGMIPLNACLDFNSLYPTTQRIFNIGPETYKGVIMDPDAENKEILTHDGKIIPVSETDIITADINDDPDDPCYAVFDGSRDCTTKNMLSDIYASRKIHKKKMIEASMELKDVENRIEYLQSML